MTVLRSGLSAFTCLCSISIRNNKQMVILNKCMHGENLQNHPIVYSEKMTRHFVTVYNESGEELNTQVMLFC